MEFKFRAVDERPPPPPTTSFSSSSTVGYFSELAFRANHPNIDPRLNPELIRSQMLRREMEKERIREQIIAEEIAWRQSLEAEVRRELMMEREMAIRLGRLAGEGLSFQERLTMRLDPGLSFPFMNQFDNRLLQERPGRSLFDPPPQRPRLSEALAVPEAKPASEDNKDKLIMLAKPDPNLCGGKRKAATPPAGGAGELPFAGLNKKPKEEWSCALCQVSATSEKGLRPHLRGKKHKAKEARLRAIKMAKKPILLPLTKDTAKQAKLTSYTGGSELEAEGTLKVENINDLDKKIETKEDAGDGNDKMSTQKNEYAKGLKEKGTAELKKEEKTAERGNKKFNFWCEMCQIGTYCAVAMEDHKKGKKHAARLRELDQNGGTSKAVEKAKDAEAVAENANEKLTDNVIDKDKTLELVSDSEKITDHVCEDAVLSEVTLQCQTNEEK